MTDYRPTYHRGWATSRSDHSLVIARQWPPRFDISAQTQFPKVRRARLAHQIRQDMWRALQSVRGFSPVVQVSRQDANDALLVTAGGRAASPISPMLSEKIAQLLACPKRRARWMSYSREKGHPC